MSEQLKMSLAISQDFVDLPNIFLKAFLLLIIIIAAVKLCRLTQADAREIILITGNGIY